MEHKPWEAAHYEDGILAGVNFVREVETGKSICSVVNGGDPPEEILAVVNMIVENHNASPALTSRVKELEEENGKLWEAVNKIFAWGEQDRFDGFDAQVMAKTAKSVLAGDK
jgi:hypothetical protein